MTLEERKEFIDGLCENVKAEMLYKAKQMPDTWDGHELRQYIRDKFAGVVWGVSPMNDRRSKRRKDYENTMLITNL